MGASCPAFVRPREEVTVKKATKYSTALMAVAAFTAAACNGDKAAVDDKAAYEALINDIKERVGLISVYVEHLDKPKPQKYDPEKRTDLDRAAQYAANEIRHAANGASQKVAKSKSEGIKALTAVLDNVSRTCAEVEGDEQVGKCRDAVSALDAALQEHASKASAAGVTAKFPRIAPEFITEKAKVALAMFNEARGPGPVEAKYLEQRRDTKVTPDELASACEAGAAEATATLNKMEKTGDAEIRKVAAHHKAALDGQCNRMKDAASLVSTIVQCMATEKKDEEMEAACRLACSKIRGRVERGIPTAGLERLSKDYEEGCQDYEKERQENEKAHEKKE